MSDPSFGYVRVESIARSRADIVEAATVHDCSCSLLCICLRLAPNPVVCQERGTAYNKVASQTPQGTERLPHGAIVL